MEQCSKCGLRHGGIHGQKVHKSDGSCSICGGTRSRSSRLCLACKAAYMRGHRKPLHGEARAKMNARSYANVYLRRGKISRKPCWCGAEAQMHHHDYSRPLDVIWLCRKHHLDVHAGKASEAISGGN